MLVLLVLFVWSYESSSALCARDCHKAKHDNWHQTTTTTKDLKNRVHGPCFSGIVAFEKWTLVIPRFSLDCLKNGMNAGLVHHWVIPRSLKCGTPFFLTHLLPFRRSLPRMCRLSMFRMFLTLLVLWTFTSPGDLWCLLCCSSSPLLFLSDNLCCDALWSELALWSERAKFHLPLNQICDD